MVYSFASLESLDWLHIQIHISLPPGCVFLLCIPPNYAEPEPVEHK